MLAIPLRNTRLISYSAAATPIQVKYPYFIPRNTRGNLPVYTDVRNGGTRYLVLIRNINGMASILAKDLSRNLFASSSSEAQRMSVQVVRPDTIAIAGGRWKNNVTEFLKKQGF